jgi:hypothetical protein
MIPRAGHLLPALLAGTLALPVPPLAAQKADQRAALSAWETRVRSLHDADQLTRLLAANDSGGGTGRPGCWPGSAAGSRGIVSGR